MYAYQTSGAVTRARTKRRGLGFRDRLPAWRGPGTGLKLCHQDYQSFRCAFPFPPPHSLPLHAHSELDVLMPVLSPSTKLWSLKRLLRDLGITGPRGAFTLLGLDSISRPDFSLIYGSPGDKASTRSRGPATRVTCQGNQDSLRLVLARAVACRA